MRICARCYTRADRQRNISASRSYVPSVCSFSRQWCSPFRCSWQPYAASNPSLVDLLTHVQIYGYLYLLFTTYPRIFIGNYGFTEKSIGVVYIGSGVGSFIGLFIMGMVSDKLVTAMTKRNGGKPKPEYRLPLMMFGAVLIPIGLFIYAWTAEKRVHYMAPIVGTAFVGAGMMATFVRVLLSINPETWLTRRRCPGKRTLSTCIPSTRRRFPLLRQSCDRFWVPSYRLLETACTTLWAWDGEPRFSGSLRWLSFRSLLRSGSLGRGSGTVRWLRWNFEREVAPLTLALGGVSINTHCKI
jgi:hypothetical protein